MGTGTEKLTLWGGGAGFCWLGASFSLEPGTPTQVPGPQPWQSAAPHTVLLCLSSHSSATSPRLHLSSLGQKCVLYLRTKTGLERCRTLGPLVQLIYCLARCPRPGPSLSVPLFVGQDSGRNNSGGATGFRLSAEDPSCGILISPSMLAGQSCFLPETSVLAERKKWGH